MSFGKITGSTRQTQIAIVLLALLLRLMIFPHHDQTRGFDETGYLQGSLAIMEGLPAGYKAAPAGPNMWIGWLYVGGTAAIHLLHPGPEEKAVPIQVRPFLAVNHALFDHYRDLSQLHNVWIITQLLLTLLATYAAFNFGFVRAGLAGGILMGGLLASLPLYVDFTMMSRPYMTAWAFGMLSLNAAASPQTAKGMIPAAIFMGLAIASRIEMLLFAPVVLWEFWYRPEVRLAQVILKWIGVTLVTALLAAPWLLTHLIGNLRTIATVRLEGANLEGALTFFDLLKQLAWSAQGLIGVMLGFVVVLVVLLMPSEHLSRDLGPGHVCARLKILTVAVYIILLFAVLSHGAVLPHQQGAAILALITFSVFAMAAMTNIYRKAAPWIALLILLPPLGQTIKMLHESRQRYVVDGSIAWVQAHVPAGTIVYLQPGIQNLLPTPESADALWDEVTNQSAGRRKFESGLVRFGLSADQIPRALADENLVQERGNRRGLFILGSRPGLVAPRYDVRLYNSSPVFGVHDIAAEFAKTGGVVLSQNTNGIPELGEPVAKWVSPSGIGSFVYCSKEILARLK